MGVFPRISDPKIRTGCAVAIVLASMGVVTSSQVSTQTATASIDKYQWLEEVNSERALAWVRKENERVKVLENDPRFAGLAAEALKILESPDRLAIPDLNGGEIYNDWQDATHVRGVLRRTTIADYLTPEPHWQMVLDYDALAKQENQRWVPKGRTCLYPGNELCLVELSQGGEDAVTMREFNLRTGSFVEGGFVLPRSKQMVAWIDKDTLLVSRDWGSDTLTKSGYPFVVKEWKRGEPLEGAKEVCRGAASDESPTLPIVVQDGDGNRLAIIYRGSTFFQKEVLLLKGGKLAKIALPGKIRFIGLVRGQIICLLDENWKPEGLTDTFRMGSVIGLKLDSVDKDPVHLKPIAVFTPTAKEFVEDVGVTKGRLIVETLQNVQGRVYSYEFGSEGGWTRTKLGVPDWSDNQFFLRVRGFLDPPSLWLGDATAGALKEIKATQSKFDASGATVDQFEAVSTDGTRVPYFVVRPKNMKFDGNTPTVITAYGGFQASETPTYLGVKGKLWVERGGVHVLANIRGGGEFGPAWHEAGLKTHRQRIYDDFYAVGQDLVKRRITSPRRLGITGGSNGGLLVGVEMTQHPEMWNAVSINVPLLDMLRYEQIAAGASWVAEYGSVKNPAERDFLAAISPYNQLKPDLKYPEPLIFTTTKDDRVGPQHARKFAAKMEEFGKPFIYNEIIEGGHAAGADLKERAKTTALEYMYFIRKLMD
jgi:prolyl oligopeptidase